MSKKILIEVGDDIKNKFKSTTSLRGDSMSGVLNGFIIKYLEEYNDEIRNRKIKAEEARKKQDLEPALTMEEKEEAKIWEFKMRKKVEDNGQEWNRETSMGINIDEGEYSKWKFANSQKEE